MKPYGCPSSAWAGRQLRQQVTRLCWALSFEGAVPQKQHLSDDNAVSLNNNDKTNKKKNHNRKCDNHHRNNNGRNDRKMSCPLHSLAEMMPDVFEGSLGCSTQHHKCFRKKRLFMSPRVSELCGNDHVCVTKFKDRIIGAYQKVSRFLLSSVPDVI